MRTRTQDVQVHCLKLAMPKLILVDGADAEVLAPVAPNLRELGIGPVYSWHSVQHLSPTVRLHVKVRSRPPGNC